MVLPWRFGRRAVAAAVAGVLVVGASGTGTAIALVSDPGRTELELQLAESQARITAAAEKRAQELREEGEAEQATAMPSGERITAIGDSVMLAAAPQLQDAFPGIAID